MGLSGRRVKQRIPNDPRNLSWADDAARFGSNYLSKFGWDSSKGLGVDGDGRTSHIKVSHKLDMLGIGAAHQQDPNGLAWKQNKDFENLLKRLNADSVPDTPVEETKKESHSTEGTDVGKEGESEVEGEKRKKKRKHQGEEHDGGPREKRRKEETEVVDVLQVDEVVGRKTEIVSVPVKAIVPRHRAHRARAIAAKNILCKSPAHISEILGIAPSTTTSTREQSADPSQGKLTDTTDSEGLTIEKITTSTKSVTDYFKEKLLARSAKTSGTVTPVSAEPISADATDSNSNHDAHDTPRVGLGSSRLRLEARVEEETQRMGLSKFSSLVSSSFLAPTSFPTLSTAFVDLSAAREDQEERIAHIPDVDPEHPTDKSQGKKEKKRKLSEKGVEGEHETLDRNDKSKKSKKDKKGKSKADPEVDEGKDSDDVERKRKKDKKQKKRKVEAEAETEVSVKTKQKRKHESQKLKASKVLVDNTPKSSKEKTKHQESSGDAS